MGIVIDLVINISVSDETIVSRMSGRRVCPTCGATFHTLFNPSSAGDKCDKCGAEEDAFYSEYAETAETLSDNLNLLPKLWRKKTERLGKNIFSKKLSERIK